MDLLLLKIGLGAVFAALLASSAAPSGEPAASGTTVLKTTGFWRCHFVWRTEQVKLKDGKVQHSAIGRRRRGKSKINPAKKVLSTPLPPAGWTAADFQDSKWLRIRGPLYARRDRRLARICLRGKFRVTDPAAGKLALELTYRGGVLVHVNGKEVARGHLPEGDLKPDAVAEGYPPEAYISPKKQLLRWVGFGDPKKYADRFAKRDRSLRVEIPASALRKGVNVLAIEVRRAPTDELLYTARVKNAYRYSLWSMIGLLKLRLTSPTGKGVVPNASAPQGQVLWNHPVADSVHVTDYGDPNEKPLPIEIAGTRGGVFSGQVVIGSRGTISGVEARASELKGPGGAVIPSTAIQVRYAGPGSVGEDCNEGLKACDGGREVRYKRGTRRFEVLLEKPPQAVPVDAKAGGALQPVWVTVRVPGDAKPGDYRGRLTLKTAGAKPVDLEVRLSVAAWKVPEPQGSLTHVGLIQSPHSMAMQYEVPLWSEKHWKLIDRSFQYAAQLGCKTVYVPLLRRTYFGNEHSMVRWIRDGGGNGQQKWKHDFSLVEKYIGIALKHLKKPPVVCFICWELSTGSHYAGMTKTSFVANTGVPFTIKDPKTGKLEKAVGPKWGDPGARAFWKPVLEGMRKILAKHGLEKSMMVGITGDRHPREDAVKDLKFAADVPWVKASHFGPAPIYGQPIGYATEVWGVGLPPDPDHKRQYGWKRKVRTALFPRYQATPMGKMLSINAPIGMYRMSLESCLAANSRGVGRCGLDFWPVLKDKRGRPSYILGRYPENSNWHGGWLHNSFPYILWPGKDGPLATARFETYREGLQDAEARIYLERALSDAGKKARLGAALAAEVQKILDERVRAIRIAAVGQSYFHYRWYVAAGPASTANTRKFFEAAAKVAAKLGE
jgi:hypothetical protein